MAENTQNPSGDKLVGNVQLGHSHDRRTVVMDFGPEQGWVEVTPGVARAIASALFQHADRIDGGLTNARRN